MSKPGRIPCEVLGCRRTAPAAKYEPHTRICCAKCWRLGAKADRAAYSAAEREIRRLLAKDGSPRLREEAGAAKHAAWKAVVRQASEARAGIG